MSRSKTIKSKFKAQANQSNGEVRIIGGQMRGRKLKFSGSQGLRPTLDRIRETLFNWLARDIDGSHCLDLFAGSGALGFEAASRGAEKVTLVEKSSKVSQDLKSNCQLIKADNIQVVNFSAEQFLQSNQQKYDLIFLDPPFGQDLLDQTMLLLADSLAANALLYIEQEKSPQVFIPDDSWLQLKFKQTGSFCYALYQLK